MFYDVMAISKYHYYNYSQVVIKDYLDEVPQCMANNMRNFYFDSFLLKMNIIKVFYVIPSFVLKVRYLNQNDLKVMDMVELN